jgi:hypothetical protein
MGTAKVAPRPAPAASGGGSADDDFQIERF